MTLPARCSAGPNPNQGWLDCKAPQ